MCGIPKSIIINRVVFLEDTLNEISYAALQVHSEVLSSVCTVHSEGYFVATFKPFSAVTKTESVQ